MFDDCFWHSYFALNPNRSTMTLVADVTTQALKIIYKVPFLLISGQLLHCCQWMVKKPQLLRCCQGELRKLVRVRGSGTHSTQSDQMIQHYRVPAALPIVSAVNK